jgi:DNA-binding transcriptional regulator YiaG
VTPEEVREYRARYGLSQPELARLLGLAERTVRAWERGEWPVPQVAVLAMRELARGLKVKI